MSTMSPPATTAIKTDLTQASEEQDLVKIQTLTKVCTHIEIVFTKMVCAMLYFAVLRPPCKGLSFVLMALPEQQDLRPLSPHTPDVISLDQKQQQQEHWTQQQQQQRRAADPAGWQISLLLLVGAADQPCSLPHCCCRLKDKLPLLVDHCCCHCCCRHLALLLLLSWQQGCLCGLLLAV